MPTLRSLAAGFLQYTGDRKINAFDDSGKFVGPLTYTDNTPVVIPGLWDFEFVQGSRRTGGDVQLYFIGGPNFVDFCGNGLLGYLTAQNRTVPHTN